MEHLMLKPLPYDSHALEPHIRRETVRLHYTRHHVGYTKRLAALVTGKPEETATLEWMIRRSEGAIFNSAAQIWNHNFYWRSMQPAGGGAPSGALNTAINATFGSLERLRRDFLSAGADHFGSGWLWLVSRGNVLRIITTPDADLPCRHGDMPILCADLWEHAYYLDYQDERARYLEVFIDHLVNWEFAGANWTRAAGRTPPRGVQGASAWPSLHGPVPE
jgi:Fe-Mn family superoxide dismutase